MSERLEEAEGGAEHQVSIHSIHIYDIQSNLVFFISARSLKPIASATLSC